MARTSSAPVTSVDRPAHADSARSLALRTAVGTLLAVALALGVRWVAVSTTPGLASLDPFAPPAIVASAVVAGAGAAVAYAVAVRYTARPTRTFLAIAAVAFLLMLVPVALVSPTLGVGPVGQAWLVGLHLAVAVPLVVAVTRTGTTDPAVSASDRSDR